jgi:hypothetical protein
MKQCPKCGNKYNIELKFCVVDNTPLSDGLSRDEATTLSIPPKEDVKAAEAIQAYRERLNAVEYAVNNIKLKQTETERLLSEIKERLNPRRLIGEQAQKMREYLKSKPGCLIELLYPAGNSEAYNLANNIKMELMGSGWESTDPKPDPDQRPWGEVRVEASTIENGTPGSQLTEAFGLAGFPIASARNESIPVDRVVLFIGQKPVQPLSE